MFARGSRYEQIPDSLYTDAQGRQIPYKLMRVIPIEFVTQQVHTVRQGERLDQIAFHYFGDPLQFWRICDANRGFDPDDLQQVGRQLVIPIAQR